MKDEMLKNLKLAQCGMSGVRVAACLIAYNKNDKYKCFYGSNIEIAGGLIFHAEETALVKAINEGYINLETILLISNNEKYNIPMCLKCRYTYSYINIDCKVIVLDQNFNNIIETTIRESINFPYYGKSFINNDIIKEPNRNKQEYNRKYKNIPENRERAKELRKIYYHNNKKDSRKQDLLIIKRNIEMVNIYRNKPCEVCNESFPLCCMDFHHINPTDKIDSVLNMVVRKNKLSIIINEIKKCIVVCANCHLNLTTKGKFSRYPKWFLDYRSELKCRKCGITKPLEFHHINKDTKIANIVYMVQNPNKFSKDVILKEISKCEVLCRNCHRLEH